MFKVKGQRRCSLVSFHCYIDSVLLKMLHWIQQNISMFIMHYRFVWSHVVKSVIGERPNCQDLIPRPGLFNSTPRPSLTVSDPNRTVVSWVSFIPSLFYVMSVNWNWWNFKTKTGFTMPRLAADKAKTETLRLGPLFSLKTWPCENEQWNLC